MSHRFSAEIIKRHGSHDHHHHHHLHDHASYPGRDYEDVGIDDYDMASKFSASHLLNGSKAVVSIQKWAHAESEYDGEDEDEFNDDGLYYTIDISL